MLASGAPLPPRAERLRLLEDLSWTDPVNDGVWRFDGEEIAPVAGARDVGEPPGIPKQFTDLCRRVKTIPGIGAVEAIAFSVAAPDEAVLPPGAAGRAQHSQPDP